MRECRRGNRGATKATTRRRVRHDPGFPRSFPAYCFPLRIRLRVPSPPPASASRRIYAFIQVGPWPHPRMMPEGAEMKRQRKWRRRRRKWRRRKRISSLDNRRRRVIAFALEPAIYDRSRQRTGAAAPYAQTVSGLINAGRSDGNNIQRPFLPLLGIRVLASLMEKLLPLSLIDERDVST